MAHSWQTCAALSGLVGWSSQSFLWTLSIVSISRGDMQATLDQLQVQPYLLPHRRIGCKLGCSSGETKNGHCALHFPAFLHPASATTPSRPTAYFSWRHATEGLPGPRWAICAPFHDSRRACKSQLMAFWALTTRFTGSYRCRLDRQMGQTGQTRQTGHRGVIMLTLRGQLETRDVMR
jgi:hypothetical protein